MEYKLFEELITLQALLKELGIIQSGGAVKAFLADTPVYFNGEPENRRGKKLRIGDQVDIPSLDLYIKLTEPSQEEKVAYQEEKAEKDRVAKLVKEMNKDLKKNKTKKAPSQPKKQEKKAPRFPGM